VIGVQGLNGLVEGQALAVRQAPQHQRHVPQPFGERRRLGLAPLLIAVVEEDARDDGDQVGVEAALAPPAPQHRVVVGRQVQHDAAAQLVGHVPRQVMTR
jgi:hypothetical protein